MQNLFYKYINGNGNGNITNCQSFIGWSSFPSHNSSYTPPCACWKMALKGLRHLRTQWS